MKDVDDSLSSLNSFQSNPLPVTLQNCQKISYIYTHIKKLFEAKNPQETANVIIQLLLTLSSNPW